MDTTRICNNCHIEKELSCYIRGKKNYQYKECNRCVYKKKNDQDTFRYNNDPEWKKRYIERKKSWKANNVEAQKAIVKRVNVKQRLSGKASIFDKKQSIELTDKYIKHLIVGDLKELSYYDIPKGLIEIKRKQIKLYRDAKEAKANNR